MGFLISIQNISNQSSSNFRSEYRTKKNFEHHNPDTLLGIFIFSIHLNLMKLLFQNNCSQRNSVSKYQKEYHLYRIIR